MAKVALITGASRGIGYATAIAFARAGWDIAISARNRQEGVPQPDTPRHKDGTPVSGSLEATAEAARAYGNEVFTVHMNLLHIDSVTTAADAVLDHYGRVDVLINNAIYQGPDINAPFLGLEVDTLERVSRGFITAPFVLTRSVVKAMLAQGGGTIINVTSGAGETDPPIPANQGGWGYAYGAGKAAVSRLAGVIARELGNQGIKAYTLNPGVVTTESLRATIGERGVKNLASGSAPPEVPAAVLLWLASNPKAPDYQYRTINAQSLARRLGIEELAAGDH
jgi:NAD(P)-dependent dehydrogenase (short-subunit alcohol dehydrogenase family)